jgi:hypothetical protein
MILSNEPGYYKKDNFGIRIENLIYVKQLKDKLGGYPMNLILNEQTGVDSLDSESIIVLNFHFTKVLLPFADFLTLSADVCKTSLKLIKFNSLVLNTIYCLFSIPYVVIFLCFVNIS